MRKAQAVALLAIACVVVGCGGSSSAPSNTPPAPSTAAVTTAGFRADVTQLWQPLRYADPTKMSGDALGARYAGFAAAVEAQPVPAAEISARAALASAARHAADKIRGATDPVAYGGAVGAAQGTIDGLIKALPR